MADISKIITPDGTEYNIKDTTARGLVVANPTLAGTESDLTGLQVGDVKFKVPLQVEFVYYGSSTLSDVEAILSRGNLPLCLSGSGSTLQAAFFRRVYNGSYTFVADKDYVTTGWDTWILNSNGNWGSSSTSVRTSVVNSSAYLPTGSAIVDYVKNLTLGQGYGTCDTAAATAAKEVTLSGFVLADGGIAIVSFTNAVPASATLNINSTGAKNIYYHGSAITADVISAGDTALFMYDGTQYQLLCTDSSNGTTVIANPTLAGTESDLTSLQIGSTKYRVPMQVEFVRYGTSTLSDIAAILDRGNVPVCLSGSVSGGNLEAAFFRRIYNGGYYFVADKDNITGSWTTWFIRSNGTWGQYGYALTNTITNDYTKVASAGAVYAFVNTAIDDAITAAIGGSY